MHDAEIGYGLAPVVRLAFVTVVVWLAFRGLPDGKLHVWFLDVGQGDAILIQSPDGRQILVDGGPSPSALNDELGEVLPFWDRSLDVVVMTHPDSDHANGLIPLFDRFAIGAAARTVGRMTPPQLPHGATLLTRPERRRRRSSAACGCVRERQS